MLKIVVRVVVAVLVCAGPRMASPAFAQGEIQFLKNGAGGFTLSKSPDGNAQWVETGDDPNFKATYEEKKRDENWIYLFDAGRSMWVILPVAGGVSRWSQDGGQTWTDLCNLTARPVVKPIVAANPQQVTLLSYNTHLFAESNAELAGAATYADGPREEALLARSNGKFPILAFTEVWADATAKRFSEKLGNYRSFRPQADLGFVENVVVPFRGALAGSPGMVLSVNGDWVHGPYFDYYRGMVNSDQYAFKGVGYGAARINGSVVWLIQTHAQASYVGTEASDQQARDKQIKDTLFPILAQVKAWAQPLDKAIVHSEPGKPTWVELPKPEELAFRGPIVLMGDMNIVGESEEYRWFAEELGKLGFHDCWTKTNPGNPGYTYVPARNSLVQRFDPRETTPQRLDYIFLNPGKTGAVCTDMKVLTDWAIPYEGETLDISDHYPVSATFTIPPIP